MPISQIREKIKTYAQKFWEILKKHLPTLKKYLHITADYIRRSWKSIALSAPLLIFLYYIVGGWVTDKIDTSPDFTFKRSEQKPAVIDATAELIKREVDDHLWTPNLPIIFPGYALDNMPRFQSGIIWSLREFITVLHAEFPSENLKQAAELLNYPENIWLLSKGENLKLAPSSGAQYRKARNALLQPEEIKIENTAANRILKHIQKKFGKIDTNLIKQIREESGNWTDFKADDVFYYNQGRLYGFYVILKALGTDLQSEIVRKEQYEAWTSMIKTMENGLKLNPLIVRNGSLDSSFSPNHLVSLDYYTVKAQYQLGNIISKLSEEK